MIDIHQPLPLDLTRVLADPDPSGKKARKNEQPRNDRPEGQTLDDALYLACKRAVDEKKPVEFKAAIRNTDRTVGARLAGYIAQKYGDAGLRDGAIVATFEGSAGQSFGAFCINGMQLNVVGEANDYVGKSMSGGEIVIRPPKTAKYATNENAIIGNTVLYGATGGTLYAAGQAGERFCVRNSGAVAVIEGVGDHACEYMTGGTVVVLGEFGRNFGAGMSGGIAFVYDPNNKLPTRLNPDMVKLERLDGEEDDAWLRELVKGHATATESRYAWVLDWRWGDTQKYFWRVVPK
jgi:glutamate synthase domain-containing protein 3